MAEGKQAGISLRITSRSLSASRISEIIGQQPTRSFDKGDEITVRGRQRGSREHTMWLLESPLPGSSPIEQHLDWVARFLHAHQSQLSLLETTCDFDAFCLYSSDNGQGSICVSKSLIQRLRDFPIDLVFDLYLSGT